MTDHCSLSLRWAACPEKTASHFLYTGLYTQAQKETELVKLVKCLFILLYFEAWYMGLFLSSDQDMLAVRLNKLSSVSFVLIICSCMIIETDLVPVQAVNHKTTLQT